MRKTQILDRVGAEGYLQPAIAESIVPPSEEVCRYAELAERQSDTKANEEVTELEARYVLSGDVHLPSAIELRDLPGEELVQQRTIQMIGRAALTSVELSTQLPPMSLKQAIDKAARGNKEAQKLVEINIETDWLERAYKSGIIVEVELETDSNTSIGLTQHGQAYDEVLVNGIQYASNPVLKNRSFIEGHNGQRLVHHYNEGLLEDNIMLTFSLVSQNLSLQEAEDLNFFTQTMSVAMQAVTESTNGGVTVESAFVAGADLPNYGELDLDLPTNAPEIGRFDIDAIKYIASQMGIDYSNLSTEEILARPLLVPKSLFPNGIIDIVKMYDTYKDTFFGRPHVGTKDYEAHLEECKRRVQNAKEIAKETARELIAEAPLLNTPTDATKRLHELNDQKLKKLIAVDLTIDSNVLGYAAQSHVERLRVHYKTGDHAGIAHEVRFVQALGRSGSCPLDLNAQEAQLNATNHGLIEEDCPRLPKPGERAKCPGTCKKTVVVAGTAEAIACSSPDCSLEDSTLRAERLKFEAEQEKQIKHAKLQAEKRAQQQRRSHQAYKTTKNVRT